MEFSEFCGNFFSDSYKYFAQNLQDIVNFYQKSSSKRAQTINKSINLGKPVKNSRRRSPLTFKNVNTLIQCSINSKIFDWPKFPKIQSIATYCVVSYKRIFRHQVKINMCEEKIVRHKKL